MLEECGLDYTVKLVNIMAGEQFAPEFLAISPNNRIPAIVDLAPMGGGDSISVFETGAILQYLAEKTGRFMPADLRGRTAVTEWLMWQMGGLGPMLGQSGHFKLYAPEKIPYAMQRYEKEVLRLYGVLDRQLSKYEHVAGAEYSIADMAIFPWVRTYKRQEVPLENFPHVLRWYKALKERPSIQRGLDVAKEAINRNPQDSEKGRKILFGIEETK